MYVCEAWAINLGDTHKKRIVEAVLEVYAKNTMDSKDDKTINHRRGRNTDWFANEQN